MTATKFFTTADISSKTGRKGAPAWLIYKDSVYDVTSYVNEHPGGEEILEGAGKDATSAFDSVGHSSDAKTILAKHKIGEIVEEEKKYDANGKKRKVESSTEYSSEKNRGCLSFILCGLI